MYHVYNVIKFLQNDSFCDYSTLMADIEQTGIDYFTCAPNDATTKLYSAFCNYLMNKQQEALYFAAALIDNSHPMEYRDVVCYYYLPFRNSKMPMADKRIIEIMLKIENLSIDQFIMDIIGNTYYEYYNGNRVFLDRLNWFFNDQHISFDNIGNTQKIGWKGDKIPFDENKIIMSYQEVINDPSNPNSNKKVGDYGELMLYKHLLQQANENFYVMWVSRDLGDGFGYDLATYSVPENKVRLYEVKTTSSISRFYNFDLSEYESRICNLFRSCDDTEYHVVRVYLGDKVKMIDIDDKTQEITNLDNEGPVKLLLRSTGTNNKYLLQ